MLRDSDADIATPDSARIILRRYCFWRHYSAGTQDTGDTGCRLGIRRI